MTASHLSTLLACATLLLAVCRVSADPEKAIAKNPILRADNCPVLVQVGTGYGLAYVPLQDTLEFSLSPNMPLMSMKFAGDDVLYKASVDGTMVKLFQCDMYESNCTIVNQGGTKSSNLLVPYKWNRVFVKYDQGQITVDINMKSRVMGGYMSMSKGHSKGGSGGQVTFMVPPGQPSYSATLQIHCSDTPPQIRTELPILFPSTAATTTESTSLVRPYKDCPMYQVEADHPSIPAPLHEYLSLAVYPNQPTVHLVIASDHVYLEVQVDDSRAELKQCNVVSRRCSTKDELTIASSFIAPEHWNFFTIDLLKNKISISINNRRVLTGILPTEYHKRLNVKALAPPDASLTDGEHFVAYVNVECEVTVQTLMTWPAGPVTQFSTQGGLPTKAPVVEVTDEPSAPGISRDVGIVVGVLAGVLLIIALAIIITTVKKRRSAAISERSPLQNQHQQQD